jgi:putative transposase
VILGVFVQEHIKENTPMALDESALPELLDALRAGDRVNLIRDAVRLVMQELIELEATEAIGAARYERTEGRTNEGNGHRPRLLATQAGDIESKIPKLSHGSCGRSVNLAFGDHRFSW